MATMQHVITINGMPTTINKIVGKQVFGEYFGMPVRLVMDTNTQGRLVMRQPGTGKFKSFKARF